ncbi:MAG: glycosyltransferase [Nitrospira sp.]|nr:glycosyltransferase [Nitrospira sp.]
MANLQPLRILFLHPTFTFGGAERTTANLFSRLNKDRFKVTLVASRKIALRLYSDVVEKIIYVEDIGMGIWFDGIKSLWKDIRITGRLLLKEKPDIALGMMHYSSTILALAKKFFRPNVKVISSPRGPSTDYLNTCFTKKSERFFLRMLFLFFCRYSDGIVVPSAGTGEDCIKNFGAKRENIRVINNSIIIDEISEKGKESINMDIPDGTFVISTSGRLSSEKNIPFLLNAFSELRKTEKVKLLVIGDGPERDRLQALASGLGIKNDTTFVGFQENPYKFIRRSDVFVHTCLVEGFGNSIIEAMACGVPVIATDCPYGPGEIIKNGENGILVPVNDIEALAKAIHVLLQDERRRKELSEKGFSRSLDFSVDRMVRAYEDFFFAVKPGTSNE